jgi:GNAT superfamily N-acetyltransferase
MDITIKPLSPELLDDYLLFFDNMVFTEHPDWARCYCYSFHFTGTAEAWTRDRNRKAVATLISEGMMKGYLAYSGNTPVGWCNVNDRKNFQSLAKTVELPDMPGKRTASVVCFVVQAALRGKGIAGLLLEKIIADYSKKGYDYLEAYPVKGETSCEKNFKGPLSLYDRNNFLRVKETRSYYIVRKALKE